MAEAEHLRLAVSNPCFELWLLLHFRDGPGARRCSDLQSLLRGFMPGYNKHLNFASLSGAVADAERRARELDVRAREDREAHRNPTTGMFNLVAAVRSG